MSATPSPARKRRRVRPRDSIEDDEDDHLLDEMLVELGIPGGRSRRRNSSSSTASVEVIELISPPRDAQLLAANQKKSGAPVFVDLTTPSPPPRPFPPSSSGYVEEVAVMEEEVVEDFSVQEDEQQDEISFSYSPSESPPPFVYSLPPEAGRVDAEVGGTGSPSSPEVLSPDLPSTARRQVVFPDERRQRGPKQARRLSGRLEGLHSETTRNSSTTGSSARTKSGASPSRSSSGARSGGATSSAAGVLAVVQMEKSLDVSATGDSIREALKNHLYNGKPVPFTVSTALHCIRSGVIRWERKESGDSHFSCAIYYEAAAFLDMLQHKSYKELVAAVRYIQSLVPKPQTSRRSEEKEETSKFFVIIEGLDRALIELKKRQKKKKGTSSSASAVAASSPMIAFADLHEVAFQLYMDVGAHTKFTIDVEATAEYVALLTRELVVASSRASVLEEFLESVPRYNSFRVTHSGATASASANAWLRMLQVIPGVSEDKAQCLLDHFPTYGSLMRAYRDPRLSRAEKEDLVADKLHDARIQRALSKRIFAVFCEGNPDAVV